MINKETSLMRIARLCNAFGPSGYETEAALQIEKDLPFCEIQHDSIGNVYAYPHQMK